MRIYSWNILFRNKDLDAVLAFIRDAEFDIFCLQEVPSKFLERLRELPYHIADAIDVDRLFVDPKRLHLVLLSRYPISRTERISYADYWHTLPWRAKLLVRCLRPLGWSKIANRSGLSADLETPRGPLRIFNLHLILATPEKRLQEFEHAMAHRDPSLPTLVCGDFNIVESPTVSLLNWLLGGSVADVLRYGRERLHIEKRFVEYQLINPHRGRVTHAFGGSQFDHILVPHDYLVEKAVVIPERYGSDHHPILVVVREQ